MHRHMDRTCSKGEIFLSASEAGLRGTKWMLLINIKNIGCLERLELEFGNRRN